MSQLHGHPDPAKTPAELCGTKRAMPAQVELTRGLEEMDTKHNVSDGGRRGAATIDSVRKIACCFYTEACFLADTQTVHLKIFNRLPVFSGTQSVCFV